MSDYAIVNPATGEQVKEYSTITDAELEEAMAKSERAFTEWTRNTTLEERIECIRKVAGFHTERREELARIIGREMGKVKEQSLEEIDFCAAIYEYFCDNAPDFLKDEPINLLAGEGRAYIRRSAQGPLLGIMPWNFPYYQVARFAGPNLILGNTILLKPAPQCPESSAAIQQMMDDAGVPEGVYQTIRATNEQAGDVIADPRIRGVSLTGSERAGAAVAEQAGRHLKKVVLELGGSDPFIMLDGDVDEAVEAAVEARIDNAGQACNAAKRFIVTDELYDRFLEGVTAKMEEANARYGDPADEDSDMGPLSSNTATERLREQLDRAVEQGAKVVTGGGNNGNFWENTVLVDVTPENDAYREEFFGPIATVYRVGSEEEAIKLANDTSYGLGSYVYTPNIEQAERVADQLDTGMVFVNGVGLDGAELPFGGVKHSGFGRELGPYGMDEFVNKKLVRIVE